MVLILSFASGFILLHDCFVVATSSDEGGPVASALSAEQLSISRHIEYQRQYSNIIGTVRYLYWELYLVSIIISTYGTANIRAVHCTVAAGGARRARSHTAQP